MIITRCADGFRVDCPAKLNLFLELHGKRPDGYHELATVMVTVGLFDTLDFREEPTENVRLACFDASPSPSSVFPPSEELPTDERNLVVRAANLLREHAGVSQGVSISLHKRIPSEAGLAGGSSDAAATLLALNRFWELEIPIEDLRSLAGQLGSDIPFFLADSPLCLCTGRGEVVEPLSPAPKFWTVIVKPPFGLSTAQVYRHSSTPAEPRSPKQLIERLQTESAHGLEQLLHNRLQESAERIQPQLKKIEVEFATVPGVAHQMSGSGSAWFGICRSRARARQIAARLNARGLGRVYVAETCP